VTKTQACLQTAMSLCLSLVILQRTVFTDSRVQ